MTEVKYGIEIVKPWSKEMYAHNEKVESIMKDRISRILIAVYKAGNKQKLITIGRAIHAYGYGEGYDIHVIYENIKRELENMPRYWLAQDCWPTLVDKGFVNDVDQHMIGYKN